MTHHGDRSGDADQHDRVDHEQDREADRPAIQVALDERAAAQRPSAATDAEGTRQAGVLARVHEDQEHQADADEDLDDLEDRGHGAMVAPSGVSLGVPAVTTSSACMISIASARRERSTAA